MNERKTITYIGIILAVDGLLYKCVSPIWYLLPIDIGVLILCEIINKIEFKFLNSHHKWIDWLFYCFSKRKEPYIIEQKNITYTILSQTEATCEFVAHVHVKKASNNFCYVGRYQWEQDKEIDFQIDENKFSHQRKEECNWTTVEIKPKDVVHKKDNITFTFNLNDLFMSNLPRHSFLSSQITAKTKHLNLTVRVNPDLKPTSAEFIVKNAFNKCIGKPENISYDKNQKGFEKTVYCPRKGRKYILQWGYEIE